MKTLLPVVSLSLAMSLLACSEPAPPTMSLYLAVERGDLDQVKRHLYWNTEIGRPDATGDLPLHVAAGAGRVDIARRLVRHGADPLALNAAGETPLEVALANGKTQVAQMLVEQGTPLDAQAMLVKQVAAGVSDRDVFEFLLRRGAQVNRADADGNTPLHIAILRGHLATVGRLLIYGADVNQKDGSGRLPLDLARTVASNREHPDGRDILKLLERSGARADPSLNPERRPE